MIAATLLILLILPVPRGTAEDAAVRLAGTVPGTTLVVTASEGPKEPRSIGSYALRLYAPFDPAWPYDNYVSGAIRSRDGALDEIRFEDLDGDGSTDIVVVIRSAGSGGYLSADGFLVRGHRLSFLGHVGGLPPASDPVGRLRRPRRTE